MQDANYYVDKKVLTGHEDSKWLGTSRLTNITTIPGTPSPHTEVASTNWPILPNSLLTTLALNIINQRSPSLLINPI